MAPLGSFNSGFRKYTKAVLQNIFQFGFLCHLYGLVDTYFKKRKTPVAKCCSISYSKNKLTSKSGAKLMASLSDAPWC